MSKIIDMAIAIDEEFQDLRNQVAVVNQRVYELEEQLTYQKAKNRDIASIFRELVNIIEREEK